MRTTTVLSQSIIALTQRSERRVVAPVGDHSHCSSSCSTGPGMAERSMTQWSRLLAPLSDGWQ